MGLCTPLTHISAHPDGCLCSCDQNGRLYSSGKTRSSAWKFYVVADSSANDITWPVSDITGTLTGPQSRCWVWKLAQGHTAVT